MENQKAYLPKRMCERMAYVGKYIKEQDEILIRGMLEVKNLFHKGKNANFGCK